MTNNLGNKETMARNIKYYMEKNNINSLELCRVLGVPQSTFSYWLNAKTYPRIDKIEKMANYFGIAKADLVEDRKTRVISENIEDDAELLEYLEYLRTRPEARILMSTMRGATKEEVEENVRFIEALRKSRNAD
jgi:transcriptional regulator with XRE-family HTH domain